VCREKQPDDPIIIFKLKVEDELRKKYRDAIQSLEEQVEELMMPDLVPVDENDPRSDRIRYMLQASQYMMRFPPPPSEYLMVD
jgi:hypothetical protein